MVGVVAGDREAREGRGHGLSEQQVESALKPIMDRSVAGAFPELNAA